MSEAMDIHIQVSAWTHTFISFGRREGAKLLCHLAILCLKLLRASRWFSTVTRPPSPLPPVTHRFLVFPYPQQHLPLSLSFRRATSWWAEWYLTVAWSAPPWWLMTRRIFWCVLSLELCDISFTHSLLQLFGLGFQPVRSLLYFLAIHFTCDLQIFSLFLW